MKTKILPELDLKRLQEKATEYAMKGAIKEIEDYYSGYNSPFRETVKKQLEENALSIHLEIPDILSLLNQSLSTEIDRIANNSIAETFIPLATKALTRIEKEIKFSEILKEFVRCCKNDFKEGYKPDISINESEYGWLEIKLSFEDYRGNILEYDTTFHKSINSEGKYSPLSLPRINVPHNYTKVMKLENGEGSIEIPFTRDTLKDEFTSYFARLVICKSVVEMDCDDFSEEMFNSEY